MQEGSDSQGAASIRKREAPPAATAAAQADLFLAVGNCTWDDVVMPDGQISSRQLGGNAVYAAAGMRLWGVDVRLVSVVGADYPQEWIDQLAEAGIDVSAVSRIGQPHLLRARAFYLPDGRRTELIGEAGEIIPPDAGENIDLVSQYADTGSPLHRRIWPIFSPTPAQLAEVATAASFAHLAPAPLERSRANAALLKQRNIVISFDWPWWDWDQEARIDTELLQNVDYLLPSVEELMFHSEAVRKTDGAQPTLDQEVESKHGYAFRAARRLLAFGPRGIGVKMGARGMRFLLRGEGDWRQIPAYPTQVVDPTGAGDAFCGGFLVGLAQTGDPIQASLYGAISSSFIIEDFGVLHALNVETGAARSRLQQLQSCMAGRT